MAALTVVAEVRSRPSKNIDSRSTSIPNWNPETPEKSLTEIHLYVLEEAVKSTQWYWQNKGAKALWSQIIRFAVWALATAGGLLPVVAVVLKDYFHTLPFARETQLDLTNGLWASLLLGLAAGLLGLDKAFGFSSGWARYVLAGTNIRKSLEDFRLDWAALRLKAGSRLTADTVAPLIERAKQFRSEIEGLVLQETKDWVTEFQSSMAQMEKDVAAQLSNLKVQVDKTTNERAANQPGYIRLTLKDPNNLIGKATLTVTLFDGNNQAVPEVQQQKLTSSIWVSPFVAPGLYLLKVEGTFNGLPFLQTRGVTVTSGAEATPSAPEVELK